MKTLPDKYVIAVVALQPLPGSPLYAGDPNIVFNNAISDVEIYKRNQVDGILLTNDYDYPYQRTPIPHESIQLIKTITKEARALFKGLLGLKVKEEANLLSMQIASENDLDFIRVGNFVYGFVSPNGLIEGCAAELLRERKKLGAEHIKIFADVKKKHVSHAISSDLSYEDRVKEIEGSLGDAVVVTSRHTGQKPDTENITKARKSTELPVILGSGVSAENIGDFYSLADGFIIGSSFRKDGRFSGEVDERRVEEFMKIFQSIEQ